MTAEPQPRPSFVGPDAPRLPEALFALACGLLFALPYLLSGSAEPPRYAVSVLLGGLLPTALALAAAAVRSAVSGVPLRRVLHLRPRPIPAFALFAAAGVLAAVALFPVSALSAILCEALGIGDLATADPLSVFVGPDTAPSLRAAIVVVALLLAPVGEELLYRAILYRGLASRLPRAALPLSAAFFSAIHLSAPHFLPLFALALLLGLSFRRRGLAAAVGLHAGFNAANLVAALLLS